MPKISQLDPAPILPLVGNEPFVVVQNGVTVKAPVDQIPINLSFPTIAALEAGRPPIGEATVYVEGYYASGDGGGHWRTRGTGAGEVTDAAAGTWVVVNENGINVRHYGAKGDGTTSDATAFQNAALNITALCATLVIPPGSYSVTSAITLPDNFSAFIQGAGSRSTTIKMNGATGGFVFTNSAATVQDSKFLGIAGLSCTTTTNNTLAAFYATWRPCNYHLRPYLYVDDVWIGVEDNDAMQAFAYGLRLSSVIHGYIGAYSFNNSLINRVGTAISYDDYCLANMVVAPQINQCGTGISFGELSIDVVSFESQTINFTNGATFTATGGASGVVIKVLSDVGTTGTVALWVGSGTINPGDVITDDHGGNGTAVTVTPRTYGSEGLQITSGSIVGCDYGITAIHSDITAKRGALIDVNGTHINSLIYDVYAKNMYQVFVKGCDLYVYGAAGEMVRLVGVDQASIIGNEYHLGAAVANVIGVHILPFVTSPFNSVNIDVNSNKFFSLATGIQVEAAVEKTRLYYNSFQSCTTDIDNLSTVYPDDLDGVDIRDNWYGDGTFDAYYASTLGVNTGGAALARVHFRNDSATEADPTMLLQNKNSSTGSAGVAFQVAYDAEYATYGPKAAILQNRTASFGRGPIKVYQRDTANSTGITSGDDIWQWDEKGNSVVGRGGLATTATDGFLYVPSCPGIPTGVPTTHTNRVPLVVNRTNNKLYGYIGGAWRDLTGA